MHPFREQRHPILDRVDGIPHRGENGEEDDDDDGDDIVAADHLSQSLFSVPFFEE